MMNLQIDLPRIICHDDYHEIEETKQMLQNLFNTTKLKVEEIGSGPLDGFDTTMYYGIVYAGKLPDENKIQELLEDYGCDIERFERY